MAALPFQPDDAITALRRAMFAQGFQPVPVKTGEKSPIGMSWPALRGVPPLARVTMNTGVNCASLRAIDIDIDDAAAAQTAVAVAFEQLGATPLVRLRTTSPRRLLVYRGAGSKRVVKTLAGKVEILGRGQQFVAFGIHPDGSEFEWEDDTPANFALADLPEVGPEAEQAFIDALADALGLAEPSKENQPETQAPSAIRPVLTVVENRPSKVGLDFREVNDLALVRLAAWVPAIFPGARLQAGTGAYRVTSRQLGRSLQEDLSLAPTGIVDFGVADMGDARDGKRTPIDVVMEWGSAADAVEAARWLADRLGVSLALGSEPVPVTVVEAAAAMAGAKRKAAPDDVPSIAIDLAAGVSWDRPGGIIAEMVDWIMATSPMPNRPLAVASATSVLSTVCGRHLYSASGTALNIYVAMLAKTGVGKDRPLSAASEILHAAGMGSLARTAKTFAVSGLEKEISDAPCQLAWTDELGTNLLARISSKRANTHEQAIKGALLELWSRSLGKGPFLTTTRAQASSVAIHSPSYTLLGASTPDAFYDSLKGGDVLNGFMNRFLIADAAPRAEENEDVEMTPVPQIVIDTLQGIVPAMDGNLGSPLGVFSSLAKIEERKLDWGLGVRDVVRAFKKQVNAAIETPFGELWGRTYEYAIRLGGLHAVSARGPYAQIELADMQWGAAWAVASAKSMAEAAENLMSKSDYEAKFNDVQAVIKKAGTITRSALLRAIRHLDARDLTNITNHLAEAGIVELLDALPETGGKGGRPIRSYRWRG